MKTRYLLLSILLALITILSPTRTTQGQEQNAMFKAILNKDLAAVKDLVENKYVDVNAKLNLGDGVKGSPLAVAIDYFTKPADNPPSVEVIRFLLEQGANPDEHPGDRDFTLKDQVKGYIANWKSMERDYPGKGYGEVAKMYETILNLLNNPPRK
jgi:hypothetical protein